MPQLHLLYLEGGEKTSIIETVTQGKVKVHIKAQKETHSERRMIVLTAVVATEILVLAEVVALSFIA